MKKFKCLLTAMLLGCSTMSFAQFMNGGGSSSSSSDNTPWKGLRFSYDRTFVNIDIDDAPSQDMNGFSLGYVQSFSIAKKLPLFFETGAALTSHVTATAKVTAKRFTVIPSAPKTNGLPQR